MIPVLKNTFKKKKNNINNSSISNNWLNIITKVQIANIICYQIHQIKTHLKDEKASEISKCFFFYIIKEKCFFY